MNYISTMELEAFVVVDALYEKMQLEQVTKILFRGDGVGTQPQSLIIRENKLFGLFANSGSRMQTLCRGICFKLSFHREIKRYSHFNYPCLCIY